MPRFARDPGPRGRLAQFALLTVALAFGVAVVSADDLVRPGDGRDDEERLGKALFFDTSLTEEDDVVAFLRTLTDGYTRPRRR